MEKIVLIYPKIGDNESTSFLPLSLIYIASPLKRKFEIKIIDQRVDKEWHRTLKNELALNRVICVGISSMTGPQIWGAIEAAGIVKRYFPDLPIVWGGVHPSLLPEETIQNEFVDIVVIGDGEETFTELVDVLREGGNKSSVRGIIYKDGDAIIKTQERGQFPIAQVDHLEYDLIDIKRYIFSHPWTNRKILPLITSRGCPYKCAYCYNTKFSNSRWSSLSAEQTVSAITDLVNKYHITGIFLLDDNFFVSLERVSGICELLIRNNLNIHIYNANCRVDTIIRIEDELLRLMKKVGFNHLYIGVESGSDRVLEKIKKDITIEQVLITNEKLKNIGITPIYSFMVGFSFETMEEIKKTVLLMNRLLKENSDAIIYKLQIFTPFPGTELFYQASRLGMKLPSSLQEWADYHYDKINYNGFDERHKRFLEDIHYYTSFLDKKLRLTQPRHRRLISDIYSGILKFRLNRRFYSYMYELYPLRIVQKIRSGVKS